MKKIKTKGPFITKANRVISKKAGEIIRIPDADYEEVKDLCEILEDDKPKTKKLTEEDKNAYRGRNTSSSRDH